MHAFVVHIRKCITDIFAKSKSLFLMTQHFIHETTCDFDIGDNYLANS